jgi:hypothetical protein
MNSISKLALILVLIVVNSNSTLAQSDAEKQNDLKEMLDAMGYKLQQQPFYPMEFCR